MNVDNPFGQRGRINDPDKLFDRDYELRSLRNYLMNGTCCQVVAPPGFGKSSLLYTLTSAARKWDERLTVGYLDLQDPRCHTVSGLLQRTWESWDEEPAESSIEVFAKRVEDWIVSGRRLVLCLDEFEELTYRHQEFSADFFLDLRSIAQQGMVIVTASHQPLSTLVPSRNPVSPFFNIFALLRLGPFSEEDAEDFVTISRPGVPSFTAEEKQVILDFANGHPLALQIACFYVLEGKKSGTILTDSIQKARDDLEAQLLSAEGELNTSMFEGS